MQTFFRVWYNMLLSNHGKREQGNATESKAELSAEEYEQRLEEEIHEWTELILGFYKKYGPHVVGSEETDEETS